MSLGAASLQAQMQESASVSQALRGRIDEMRQHGSVTILGEVVPTSPFTIAVYEQSDFEPLWEGRPTEGQRDPSATTSLLSALAEVRGDGLDPEDYHASALAVALELPLDATRRAELDILRTDALVRVSHDLRFGKVGGQWPGASPQQEWPRLDADAAAKLAAVIASGRVRETLHELRPRRLEYATLTEALRDLRRIQTEGGWAALPPGPSMRPGDWEERVPHLRRRLALEGYLPEPTDETNWLFDSEVEEAVRAFQRSRGLAETGTVTESTLAALNVSVEELIDRVRINLERLRWDVRELPDTFVEVNVAGAMLRVVAEDSVVFESRVIVGAPASPTPALVADILHVTLNPSWTVPPGIVKEVLAAVRRDPDYLRRQSMRIIDAAGRDVDPTGIDFTRYTEADFPYRFRQDAGPLNPLGQIKLIMPNAHFVYLHDTPARDLFALEDRFLSHGCVRVANPLGLAEVLLRDRRVWNRATLQAAIATGRTTSLPLPAPVPVRVLYWTAGAGPDGRPRYYADVYERDPGVLSALDAQEASGTRWTDRW